MSSQTTERIIERFPEFYKTRTKSSILYQFLDGFGKSLSEAEKDLFRVLRGHWVDTGRGKDLDLIGSTFNLGRRLGETDTAFRRRIKVAVSEFKGGGTISSLRLAVRTLLNPYGDEVQIEEFPETPITVEKEVSSGDVWNLSSMGIAAASPKITLTIAEKNVQVRDPKITNTTLNRSIGMEGILKSGQELVLASGSAYMDGKIAKVIVPGEGNPEILRAGSEWQYAEFLHGKLGVFDTAIFDESFFATPLPKVRARFDWTTRKSSTVAVTMTRAVLERTGVAEEEVVKVLNAVKACGIEVVVKITEPQAKPEIVPAPIVPPTVKAPVSPEVPTTTKEVEVPA